MVWEYDEDGSGEVLFPLAQQRGEAGTETRGWEQGREGGRVGGRGWGGADRQGHGEAGAGRLACSESSLKMCVCLFVCV